MSPRESFRLDEIDAMGAAGSIGAVSMARRLERYADEIEPAPPADFADVVMIAIATEPSPAPARAFGVAVRHRRLRGGLVALRDAWRVATSGARPMSARASALGVVLVLALGVASLGGGAAIGAWTVLRPEQAPAVVPSVPPANVTPSPSPPATVTPSPTPALGPTESENDDGSGDPQDHDTDDGNTSPP